MKEAGREGSGLGEALFEDLDFPSDDRALFSDSSTPIATLQGEVTWRRPQVSDTVEMPACIPLFVLFMGYDCISSVLIHFLATK